MRNLTIRPATTADAVACAAIYAPYVTETVISFETVPPPATEMGRRIVVAARTHAWLVAERGGAVVGYAYGHPFAERAAYRWSCETSIYLSPDHRGAGIGRALYEVLLDRLADRGYLTAFAGISLPNDASIALHTAFGFEPAGTYRQVGWKNDAWHDVTWLQRSIGEHGDRPADPR